MGLPRCASRGYLLPKINLLKNPCFGLFAAAFRRLPLPLSFCSRSLTLRAHSRIANRSRLRISALKRLAVRCAFLAVRAVALIALPAAFVAPQRAVPALLANL